MWVDRETTTDESDRCWNSADRAGVLGEAAAILWLYVGRHAAPDASLGAIVESLTGLEAGAFDTLLHLHALLLPSVEQFLDEGLDRLTAHLSPTNSIVQHVGDTPVRGRIDWAATVAARSRSGGYASATYASAAAQKHWNTPTIRLLLWLLGQIERSSRILLEALPGASLDPRRWETTVASRRSLALAGLRTVRLATRGACERASASLRRSDLDACLRSTRHDVVLLARAGEDVWRLVERQDPSALIEAVKERVLVPLSNDALYEVWAFGMTARASHVLGLRQNAVRMIGQSSVPLVYKQPDGTFVRLRYGAAPAHWRERSQYKAIFDRYGLDGATRRPDIVVEVEGASGGRRWLLIEVKRTRDPGYIADSVYKVLGYLADFAPVFDRQSETRGLLLLWDGITRSQTEGNGEALVLATHHDFAAQVSAALRSILVLS